MLQQDEILDDFKELDKPRGIVVVVIILLCFAVVLMPWIIYQSSKSLRSGSTK